MEECWFSRAFTQVLHGCRQLVSWDVGLSPATSATLILSCHHLVGDSRETASVESWRKVGTTSSHHGPYVQGYTRATMVGTKSSETVMLSESHKANLSSDWGLQLDLMKSESLVIVRQNSTVNTFPGLVHTARQVSRIECTRRRWANRKEAAFEGVLSKGD